MPLTAGARLGRYEVRDPLGAGHVYLARDDENTDVALRLLAEPLTDAQLTRLEQAVAAVARFRHPSAAAVYSVVRDGSDKTAFAVPVTAIVTELAGGTVLPSMIADPSWSAARAIEIACSLAEVLDAAHSQGIVHGHLGADSVRVSGDHIKVIGFDLSALAMSTEANLGDSPGQFVLPNDVRSIASPYLSPESRVASKIDRRADIWAFGMIFFEMLTGTLPPLASSGSFSGWTEDDPGWALLPDGLPRHLVDLLKRCLQGDRARRLEDMSVARFRLTYKSPAEPPDLPSVNITRAPTSALFDGVFAYVQRSPRILRLLTGLARRISPVLVIGKHVFVCGANELREAFKRGADFELGPHGSPKMLMGPFLLGMDPRKQYEDEKDLLDKLLKSLHQELKDIVAEECVKIGARLGTRKSIEFVSEFAEPIVTRVASRFFGVGIPDPGRSRVLSVGRTEVFERMEGEERERAGVQLLGQWLRKVGSVIATTSPAPFGLQKVAEACAVEFRAHLEQEIERVELTPPGNRDATALAKLVELVENKKLTRDRVLPNLAGLMLAGSTALVKSITHAVEQTLRHKDQIPKPDDDEAVKGLLFESLRFNPTFPILLRFCPRSTRLGEARKTEVPAGASLYVSPAGAMFDAEVDDADRFAPQRNPAATLVFGYGTHECLGRTVATTILTRMFTTFLEFPRVKEFTRSRIQYDGPAVDRFVITRAGARS